MAPGTYVIIASYLAEVALKSGFFASEDTVKIELDRSLQELNPFEIETEQLKKLMLKKNDALNVMSTSPVATKKT